MARMAIITKYCNPTNVRGSRIKATSAAGAVYSDYLHNKSLEENHAYAAHKLASKLEWDGTWQIGQLPNGDYVFVLVSQ